MKITVCGKGGCGKSTVSALLVANKIRDEKDEMFVRDRIPESDLLGFVHYNPEIMNADREGVSPYDFSQTAVDEIKKIKEKLS